MANGKNWKEFVGMLVDLGVQNSSKEIATIINRNNETQISWQQVAGVRAAITKKSRT
jgi:radical SAM superfamily enzyme